MRILVLILILVSPVLSSPSLAQVDTFEFETNEQQQRFRKLSDELRCPKCQNTNLSGSSGGVAADLRREIHRMIIEGMSNAEIEQFMFERYGDFIFYKPRLRAETVLLWFGPLIFLLIAAVVAFFVSKKARLTSNISSGLDESQQNRLNELLDNRQ